MIVSKRQSVKASECQNIKTLILRHFVTLTLFFLALFAFSSSVYATLAKQIINPDGYAGAHGFPWLPHPDATGDIVRYETFETPSTIFSGFDYTTDDSCTALDEPWDCCTGSATGDCVINMVSSGSGTIDPNYALAHATGYGTEVLKSFVTGSNLDTGYIKIDLPTELPVSSHRYWIYIHNYPTTNNKPIGALKDTAGNYAVRFNLTTVVSGSNFKIQVHNGVTYDDIITTSLSVDTWHSVDVYYNATTNYCYARVDGGSWGSSSNAIRDGIKIIWLGYCTLVTVGTTENTVYFDDFIARDSTGLTYDVGVIPDFTAHGLVSDASQTTYYEMTSNDANEQKFNFNYANPTHTNNVKGVRLWEEVMQYDQLHYESSFGERLTTNELVEYSGTASFKKVYKNDPQNPFSTANPRAAWDYTTDLDPIQSVHRIGGGIYHGAKLTKVWYEIIYGIAGDAYVTHEFDFTATTTSIRAWVRVNEATNVALCYGTSEAIAKECNLACTATGTPWACCTNPGTGTCAGTSTTPATVTSATDYSTIFTVNDLTANTTYFFNALVQQADNSYLSTYIFENTGTANPNLANLQFCKTARVDAGTSTPNFTFGVYADQHSQPSHWDLFPNLGTNNPEFVLELGDQEVIDNIDPSTANFMRNAREQVYTRRGFNAMNVHLMEAIGSKPKYRVWSDHDWMGLPATASSYINGSKLGSGYFGGVGADAPTYAYTYKGYDLFKETQPGLDYVVDDLNIDLSSTGSPSTTLCTTTDIIYTTGINGVYPGMMVHLFNGSTYVGWSIIRNVVLGSPNKIYLTQALSAGSCTSDTYTLRVSRGFIGQIVHQGNVDFIMGDLRKKRDVNKTPGGDKLDGVAYGFVSETAASALGKDLDSNGTWNDYLSSTTGTGNKEYTGDGIGNEDGVCDLEEKCYAYITHLGTLVSKVPKWDLAGVWSSAEVFRGWSLVKTRTDYPGTIRLGLPFEFQSNTTSSSQTITVPSDATFLIVGVVAKDSSVGTILSTLTIGGTSILPAVTYQNNNVNYGITALYKMVNPPTGSQTLAWTWNSALTGGALYYVSYYKGVNLTTPIRGFGSARASSTVGNQTATTPAFSAIAGDVIAGVVYSYFSYDAMANLNTSEIQDSPDPDGTAYNIAQAAFGETTISSGTTFAFQGRGNRTAVSACSLVPTGTEYGTVELEWEIPGLSASSDRVRFFESGASDWGCYSYPDDCANVDHGHVQRSWMEQQITNAVTATPPRWVLLTVETPMASRETIAYDKWADFDGMTVWGEHGTVTVAYTAINITNETITYAVGGYRNGDYVTFTTTGADIGGLTAGNSYYVVGVASGTFQLSNTLGGAPINLTSQGTGDHTFALAAIACGTDCACPVGDNYSYVSTYTEKPGGINAPNCPAYDVACGAAGAARLSTLVEVANKSDLNSLSEWWYDATNDYVVFCANPYISATARVIVFKPYFWERASTRKYMLLKYGTANVGFVGADRHFAILDNSQDIEDPWFYAGVSQSKTDSLSHASSRSYKVNGKNSWYEAGMGYVSSYSDPDFYPEMIGCYGIFNVDNTGSKITVSLYERDGNIISNTANNDDENTWFGFTDSDWLGNMTMNISFICPYGNCDYFNRPDNTTLSATDWTEDTSVLSIVSNKVESTAGEGLAHWATSLGEGATTQFAKFKISSIGTDGEIGAILRSGASSGYRYALTFTTTGADALYWKRYDWNTVGSTIDAEVTTFASTDTISITVQGTGISTIIKVWKNTINNSPVNANNWDSASDPADYTLTDAGSLLATNPADTGTYVGIIIKKETGASPSLDDFYSGDVTSGNIWDEALTFGLQCSIAHSNSMNVFPDITFPSTVSITPSPLTAMNPVINMPISSTIGNSGTVAISPYLILSSALSLAGSNTINMNPTLSYPLLASYSDSGSLTIPKELTLPISSSISEIAYLDIQVGISLLNSIQFQGMRDVDIATTLALSAVASMQESNTINAHSALLLSNVITSTPISYVDYDTLLTLATIAAYLSEAPVGGASYDVYLTLATVAQFVGQGNMDAVTNLSLPLISAYQAIAQAIQEGILTLSLQADFDTAAQLSAYGGLLLQQVMDMDLSVDRDIQVSLILEAIATAVMTGDVTLLEILLGSEVPPRLFLNEVLTRGYQIFIDNWGKFNWGMRHWGTDDILQIKDVWQRNFESEVPKKR